MKTPILYLVIPCYNEEKVLPITSKLFCTKIKDLIKRKKIDAKSKILFVDDGSKDNTWNIISNLSKENAIYSGIRQSRNRGHQNAVLAGLMESKNKCDISISMDCDGQDDINAIDEMVKEYCSGSDVVYGVRKNRKKDTMFKRISAKAFYKVLKLMGAKIVFNHADYRLLSSTVLCYLQEYKEVNLFLRGIVPLIGFKSSYVYYDRAERISGESKYPLKKMLAFAWDGITSLSSRPLHFILLLGIGVSVFCFAISVWSVIIYFTHNSLPGWASITVLISFFSAVQLISIGVIGEYVGKMYLEVKARPRYIISEKTKNLKTK